MFVELVLPQGFVVSSVTLPISVHVVQSLLISERFQDVLIRERKPGR